MHGSKWIKWIYVLFVLWIPILAAVWCFLQSHHILDIYLPTGWCSDEVSYYKQIEAILDWGMPKGYWGYNESFARVGTFGPWSPLSFLPYILVGGLIGWTFTTPVVCNLLFLVLANILYIKIGRPGIRQVFWMGAMEASLLWITRYAMSAMLEPYIIALEIVLTAFLKNRELKNRKLWIYITVLLLSLTRPYFIVLYFLPCIEKTAKRGGYITISIIMTALTAVQYFAMRYFFAAAYVSGGMSYAGIKELIKASIEQVKTCLYLLVSGGATYGYAYALMLGVMAVGAVFIFLLRKQKEEMAVVLYLEFFIFATLGAIIVLYDPWAGSRHIFQVGTLAVFYLASEEAFCKPKFLMIAISIAAFLPYAAHAEYLFSIPYRDEAGSKVEIGEEIGEAFVSEAGEAWDHTIAINVSEVDYNYAYYLPSYLGVQIVWDYWLEKEAGNMRSRYLFTSLSDDMAGIYEESGWKVFYQNEGNDLCIYER